tara:strand:+ start:201 stop:554 length:354 start_codon:yes stop_codon:yes gene_type:complete
VVVEEAKVMLLKYLVEYQRPLLNLLNRVHQVVAEAAPVMVVEKVAFITPHLQIIQDPFQVKVMMVEEPVVLLSLVLAAAVMVELVMLDLLVMVVMGVVMVQLQLSLQQILDLQYPHP